MSDLAYGGVFKFPDIAKNAGAADIALLDKTEMTAQKAAKADQKSLVREPLDSRPSQ